MDYLQPTPSFLVDRSRKKKKGLEVYLDFTLHVIYYRCDFFSSKDVK